MRPVRDHAPCSSSCATSASPAAAAGSSTRSAPRSRPGRRRSSGPPAAASRPCCGCSTGSPTPTPARSPTAAGRWPSYDPLELRRRGLAGAAAAGAAGRDGRVEPALRGRPRRRGARRGRCLRLAGLDPGFAARDVARLSVGEQQRAMLARALAQRPEVLLLDEPTSALDHAARDAIEATLAELRRELEISLVLVSHDPEQARRLGEWVVRLEDGRAVAAGPAGGGAGVSTSIQVELWQVAASLVLVALAVAISCWRQAELERDIVVATVRSIVQLTLVGYAIKLIFEADTIWLVLALLAVMVLFGALTARSRARERPGRLLAAADRAGGRRGEHPRPRRRPRHLRPDAALPGPGRRHGDRQRDDRLGGGAGPARRRGRRLARRGSRRRWRSARPRTKRRCRSSAARCARG